MAALAAALTALPAIPVRADTVYLVGGGSYKGKVRMEADRVVVELAEGMIVLDRESVLRIEPGDDLGTQLADRRAKLDPKDADGHYRLGQWAAQNNLVSPARELFAKAIGIQPGHVAAQLALGRVYIDGGWQDSETFADTLRQWESAGLNAAALQVGRQALAGLMPQADRKVVLELTATAARRTGFFAEAAGLYREMCSMLTPGDAQYERAMAGIDLLAGNPTGLYGLVVDPLARSVGGGEAGPAGGAGDSAGGGNSKTLAASSVSGTGPARSGCYSLADDAVMDLALRDRAKDLINQGRQVMSGVAGLMVTEPAKAMPVLRQADDIFTRADAIDSGIARSYQVEAHRRMIHVHQAAGEAVAMRFDGLVKTINPANKSAADYRAKIKLGIALLNDVQKELEPILTLAGAYPAEFSVIIAWTQEDLLTVKATRRTLEEELDALAGSPR